MSHHHSIDEHSLLSVLNKKKTKKNIAEMKRKKRQKRKQSEARGLLSSWASPWGKLTHTNHIQTLDNNDNFTRPNISSKQCDNVCWCNVYVNDKRERIINISSVSRNLSFSIMFNCVLEWLMLWQKLQNSCNVNFGVFCLLFSKPWSYGVFLESPAKLNVAANVVCLLFRLQGLVLKSV